MRPLVADGSAARGRGGPPPAAQRLALPVALARRTRARCGLAALLAALLVGALATAARGATWTVNTAADAPAPGCQATGAECSIRQALARARAGDTIVIPASASHYLLSLGPLALTVPVSIVGGGAASTVIDAGGHSQVISVSAPAGTTTSISALTITGGSLTNAATSAGGGGIAVDSGGLALDGVSVQANSVTAGEGGGGVFDNGGGALTLAGSTVGSNRVSLTAGGAGGGGILDLGGSLVLTDSSVDGNSLTLSGGSTGTEGGGGVYDAATSTTITGSTIAENTATINAAGGFDGGGGIYDGGGPSVYLNDTLSDNSATVASAGADNGGGALFHDGSAGSISDVTIAENFTSANGGGIFNGEGAYTVKNTIVADNGSACAGPATIASAGFNLQGSDTCPMSMPTDITSTDPRLGPLVGNGGPTLTQALTPGSPAIDAGSCTDALGNPVTTDGRGVTRPQPAAGKCDIGAYEFVPASPRPDFVGGARPKVLGSTSAMFSAVVNPDGEPTAVRFQYGLDSRYLPPGTTRTVFNQSTQVVQLAAGYRPATISASVAMLVPAALYHVRLVAASPAGTVLGPDQPFVTATDPAPPRPLLGEDVNAAPAGGRVRALIAGRFVPLTESRRLPVGSEFDAREGFVHVTAAGIKGAMLTASFSGAVFRLSQSDERSAKGIVSASLLDGALAGTPSYARCQRLSTKVLQTLHASVNGQFQVRGRYSAATAAGGQWATTDRCDGTRSIVRRGTVSVTPVGHRKTLAVRAGHSFLATPPMRRPARRTA